MMRKRSTPLTTTQQGVPHVPKNLRTVARQSRSYWPWITVVFGIVMLTHKPSTIDYSVSSWTSYKRTSPPTCSPNNEINIPVIKDPLVALAKIREDVSFLSLSSLSLATTATSSSPGDRISLVWALDQAPDPQRFTDTLASLPPNKQVYIYCGSTACLLAAQASTKVYSGMVHLIRLSVPELSQNTPLQGWTEYHVLAKLLAMNHYEKHLQAAMQLVVLWKFGGTVVEPGFLAPESTTNSTINIVAMCPEKSHGFPMLHITTLKSVMVQSLMNEMLQIYSWDILKTLDATTNDEKMPTTPTNWPLVIDWKERMDTMKLSTINGCLSKDKTFQDGNDRLFYGTLSYDDRRRQLMAKHIPRMNIGDETQGLAGIQMLPRVDALVERDVLHQAKFATPMGFNNATDKIVMFMNAWYGIPAMKWPPPEFLEPVTLAMHFQDRMYSKILQLPTGSKIVGEVPDVTVDERTIQMKDGSKRTIMIAPFLKANRPIGARDTKTLEYFVKNGIPAFFSACMTMTLGLPRPSVQDSILIIDAPDRVQLEAVVPADVLANATILTQDLVGPLADTSISRYLYSFYRLLLYPRAKLIITARLHVALPAVALGTPVVFMHTEKLPGGGGHRLDGLDNFMHAVRGTVPPPCFDWHNPSPNPLPKDFIKQRNRLKQMSVCHRGISDSARKFGIVPIGWDAGDEWKTCSTHHVLQDDAIRVATTLDENYLDNIFPSWINALSRSNGNSKLELYILTVRLSEKQRCMVRTITLNLLPRARVFTIPVDLSDFESHYFNKGAHISISTQARLRLPSILPCIDKIAWIDLDAFVVKSLQDFWKNPVAACGITARTDDVLYLNTIDLPGDLKWHDSYGYSFNAGVLLMSLETLRQNKFEEKIVPYWAIELGFNDQVVLNMACNGTYGLLNETMNMLMNADFSKSPNPNKNWVTNNYYPPPDEWVIVHFIGSRKPWTPKKTTSLPAFLRVWEDHKLTFEQALDQS